MIFEGEWRMQRKHVLAYLLFSLFFIASLSSCFIPSSRGFSKLASEGRYEELEQKSAALLFRRIEAEPLFYRALALYQTGESEDAFHVLNLYFAMAKTADPHMIDAHRMMSILGFDAKNPHRSIVSAKWLQERGQLHETEARSYYRSLLAVGDTAEATRVFDTFLKDTINAYAYAQMVIGTLTDSFKLEEAFAPLTAKEQLTLLQSITSDIVLQERATLLLPLATPLEQAFEGREELAQVYSLLASLYGYADMRVQQRKYNTLAQNFT